MLMSEIKQVVKLTQCDPSHAERVLKEEDGNVEKAAQRIREELARFTKGEIRFGPGKEVIPIIDHKPDATKVSNL